MSRKVILDKSFLQAENRECQRLHFLRNAGYGFVLIDTLAYELCTDKNKAQLSATLYKLEQFTDHIEVWFHTADLLKHEICTQSPIDSPIDRKTTKRFCDFLKQKQREIPTNLSATIKRTYKQREEDSVEALIRNCRQRCEKCQEYTAFIQKGGGAAQMSIDDMAISSKLVALIIKENHGNPKHSDVYIQAAKHGSLGPQWFAYHHAKTIQVLWCIFVQKYGLSNQPGSGFQHTKLDADYLALLYYADAFATNETIGDMKRMFSWMYDNTKVIFSTSSIDQQRAV